MPDPFSLFADDGTALHVYRWETSSPPRAIVQIVHGLAEHAGRYAELADALTASGFAVYANDHRGHGRTAPSRGDLGFFAETEGWRRCLEDLSLVRARIGSDHPGVPVIILGHSMGSLMTRDFIAEHGQALAGVVLSASEGAPPPLALAGRWAARLERRRLGPRGRSSLLTWLSFGRFNARFQPTRTFADWLSRDSAEVDRYIADPLCGFAPTVQLWIDFLDALRRLSGPDAPARIPRTLPIHFIAGERDPVSENTRALGKLMAAYRDAGLERVTHRFYPGARHELFHEANRNEVTADLLTWLERCLKERT